MTELYIFAVNAALNGRHTYLSRSKGEATTLPDLADWLGLGEGGLDTNEIEVFPISDLAGMALSDYVTTAFGLERAPTAQLTSRMNALEGHVLLIPSAALAGNVNTGPELTLIAQLPMAKADHSADAIQASPPSSLDAGPVETEAPPSAPKKGRGLFWGMVTAFFLAILIVFVREFF